MKYVFAILAAIFWVPQAVGEQIHVDFATTVGPITHSGGGVLHSISPTSPNDSYLIPIKPSLFRAFPWATHYDRAASLGAAYQMVVSDLYKGVTVWPGDNGDWSEWENTCQNIALTAMSQNQAIQFDLWNEPDQPFFFGRSKAQFLETWKHGVNAIRSVNPNATIVGPSTSNYWWFTNLGVKDFLSYAKDNNVLPDLISWHAWTHNLDEDIQDLQAFGQLNGIDVSHISINEYLPPEDAYNAGAIPYYLNTLESYRVTSSAKSCWDTCFDTSLDGLLTYNSNPRSIWWVYERYGRMTGNIVATVPDGSLDAVASQGIGVSYALVGRTGNNANPAQVLLQNLDDVPSLLVNGNVHVLAELIDNTGVSASSGPVTMIDADYVTANGELLLTLPSMGAYDAYMITLTATSVGSMSGDFNGDGTVDAADYVMLRHGGDMWSYPAWRGNFGNSQLSAVSVAEPSTILLVAFCYAGLLARRSGKLVS